VGFSSCRSFFSLASFTFLHLIEQALIERDKTLAQYQLPTPLHDWHRDRINPLIGHELNYNVEAEQGLRDDAYGKLNDDQKRCFDIVIAAIEQNPLTAHFFLQGYAGTGRPSNVAAAVIR
jgi:hypothetical protein